MVVGDPNVRIFYLLGWLLFVSAWTDWGLATFLGFDVWREFFGFILPGTLWNMTPVIVGSFGIVLIATCR
ncbi:hypothetical protein DK847_14835 [Aestuariivirga litoralis]|uniref:Uncharacterized protein n=1 Tax=Aestuariivirga litoralis TaxID=2650924 RepID=A0A2W2BIC4_9HYPH|nr:hypothetical protein DK847_14835 [Aestuariivirga litoralis]